MRGSPSSSRVRKLQWPLDEAADGERIIRLFDEGKTSRYRVETEAVGPRDQRGQALSARVRERLQERPDDALYLLAEQRPYGPRAQ